MNDRQRIRVIEDPDVLRLIADPLRLRILELLRQRERTIKDLAHELAMPRTRLYYHVKLLEEHDLVTVVGTREVSGITERRYRTTAFRLSMAKTMLGSSAAAGTPLDTYLSFVLEEVASEIRRSAAAGLIDLEQTHKDVMHPRRMVLGRTWYRLTEEDVAEFEARFTELKDQFAARAVLYPEAEVSSDQPADGDLYELLTGFYPVVPPDQDGNDV